jgi:hypothetical protein
MQRALHVLDELRDVVEGEPRAEVPKIADGDLEDPLPGGGALVREAASQRLVHDLAERPVLPARFCFELGGDVVVEREGRPHALMLESEHHDVKTARSS